MTDPYMYEKKRFVALILAIACVVGGTLYFIRKGGPPHNEGVGPPYLNLRIVLNSIGAYKATFSDLPTGSSDEIVDALLGKNPKKVPVLSKTKFLVDPWGTSLRIKILDHSDPDSVGWTKSDVWRHR